MKYDTYDISVTKLYNQISFIPTYITEINYIHVYSYIQLFKFWWASFITKCITDHFIIFNFFLRFHDIIASKTSISNKIFHVYVREYIIICE